MNLEDIRILLVEDNPGDARLLQELVREPAGGRLRLEHVDRLGAALDLLNKRDFDAILLDLTLPDEQGLDTVLRVHSHAPKVPIVVLTGMDDEALAVRAVRAGAQDYLVKGRVDGDLLLRSVRYASERGRALEALERREEHYRSLIENSLDLISILKLDGTIRYASPSHERLLGHAPEDLVGQNAFTFVHPDDLPRLREAFQRADGTTTIEFRFRDSEGVWRELECSTRNLSHLAGVGGVVINARDITERRRLEEQLHHAQRLEAIGRLAGGVAHDFNNLLMVINGHSQMLLDAMHPHDPAHCDLEQVVKAAERATDLTRQLLAFSRRQAVRSSFVDLNTLIQEMDHMLRRLMGDDIEVRTVLASDLEPVRADRGQIEQVVLNIALNARDAMPQGGCLTLETSHQLVTADHERPRLGPKPGRYAMLSISDTGAGMDALVLSRIFEPFFTTKEQGTGLGLSTSYGIIKQTGGDIWVDSEPGAGTTFRIYLPLGEAVAEHHEASTDNLVVRGSETILLVEDEDGVRRVVETMLKRRGYNVLSAGSTTEALALSERHPGAIDLLITDMVMPGLSSRTMVDQLAARRPLMRVLYVSGYGDTGGAASNAAFLQKPFSTDELALKIREILREPV